MPSKPRTVSETKKCTAKHPNIKGLKCDVVGDHDVHSGTAKDLKGSPVVQWKMKDKETLEWSKRVLEPEIAE